MRPLPKAARLGRRRQPHWAAPWRVQRRPARGPGGAGLESASSSAVHITITTGRRPKSPVHVWAIVDADCSRQDAAGAGRHLPVQGACPRQSVQINHPSVLLVASAAGTGMEAWSVEEMRRRGKERLVDASRRGEVVPIHQVFDRIRQETQVTAPASVVDEIDKAFKKLELAAATTSLERWSELPSPLSPLANTTPSELQLDFMTGHKNPLQVGSQAVAIQPGPGELVSGLASKAAPGGLSGASILAAQDGGTSPALPAMSSPSRQGAPVYVAFVAGAGTGAFIRRRQHAFAITTCSLRLVPRQRRPRRHRGRHRTSWMHSSRRSRRRS
ncbi:Os04g0582500 [Oryza sativa Japonica Group]|uniref:Os04g0582500 protein n=1 Tax=Oryza sativa subsp. japonica TaxID=39947 RepID=A0A0P0WDV5_ORYSJ|nr:Os04g0582500 [Oryza sativa Japonica Group]